MAGARQGGRPGVVWALALMLAAIAGLAWLGYRTVAERERALAFAFSATAQIARDRTSADLQAQQERFERDVRAQVGVAEAGGPARQVDALSTAWPGGAIWWLNGQVAATRDLWSDSEAAPVADVPVAIREAETVELAVGNLDDALQRYQRIATDKVPAPTRALALARMARVQRKLGRHEAALTTYQSLLASARDLTDLRGVPYRVVAREGLVDALVALGREPARRDAAVAVLRDVVDRPWNVEASYRLYLRLTSEAAAGADAGLAERAEARRQTIEWLDPLRAAVSARAAGTRALVVRAGDRRAHAWIANVAGRASDGAAAFVWLFDGATVARAAFDRIAPGLDVEATMRLAIESDSAVDVLAQASLGPVVPGLAIVLRDHEGRTLAQLTSRERWLYGSLMLGALAVFATGVVVSLRAWSREAELSRLRTDFVSNVSHELKTPLALIRMFGETLESGAVEDPARRREFSAIIRRESDRLTHLINNVLDAAKIEAGTRAFSLESGDLVALVREALEAYAALFARLGIAVETTLPDAPVPVRMDRDAVAQAMVNLFQNAIRYAADGRHVAVTVHSGPTETSVSVADRGPGIPESELPRVFDRFYRSPATTGATAGSGLGLAIVKHVMAAHGGRVEVESVVGHGTVFSLVFPSETRAA